MGRLQELKEKKWLPYALVGIAVLSLAMSLLTLRPTPTQVMDSPRDRFARELLETVHADPRFRNIETILPLEPTSQVILSGEIAVPEDADALRELVDQVQAEGFTVEIQAIAPPPH